MQVTIYVIIKEYTYYIDELNQEFAEQTIQTLSTDCGKFNIYAINIHVGCNVKLTFHIISW